MLFPKSTLLVAITRGGLFQVQTVAGACSKVVHCLNGMAYNNRNGADFTSATGNTCVQECDGNCCISTFNNWVCGGASYPCAFSVCADEGDGSCTGAWACTNLGGSGGVAGLVSGGSCDGNSACIAAGRYGVVGDISAGSCIGRGSCQSVAFGTRGNAGDISNGSCTGDYACSQAAMYGAIGNISSSCKGDRACYAFGYDNPNFGTDAIFPMDNCCNDELKCSSAGHMGAADSSFPDDACPAPTSSPTLKPTEDPTADPTISPTSKPTSKPSGTPTADPSGTPSEFPTSKPSYMPTADPTADPTASPTDGPTADPTADLTSKPSGTPTANLSAPPTEWPTESPTESPTKAPKLVVCGKGTGCREGNVRPASEVEVHPVRCCADAEMQGNGWKKQGDCNVWASSITPHCHEDSFAKAMQICDDAGARLCTKDELTDRCTITSGCGFDRRLVWSSSPEVDLEKELQEIRDELAQCRGDVQ